MTRGALLLLCSFCPKLDPFNDSEGAVEADTTKHCSLQLAGKFYDNVSVRCARCRPLPGLLVRPGRPRKRPRLGLLSLASPGFADGSLLVRERPVLHDGRQRSSPGLGGAG